MRLAVYSDFSYRCVDGSLYAELPFALFLVGLASQFDRIVLIGRLEPAREPLPYRLPPEVEFVALPHYPRLSDPLGLLRAAGGSLRRFWGLLGGIDAAWLLGPHPLAIAFAGLARLRGRRVVLGVRQDLPSYTRHRHPDRRLLHALALILEWGFRRLGRRHPVVVVGADLARRYAAAPRLLEVWISLVSREQIAEPSVFSSRRYDGPLTALSVGRLDPEKNPLLLADIIARVAAREGSWRLVVCGDGSQSAQLVARTEQLGIAERVEIAGHVPLDGGLLELYRHSHAFLHVSWTEGMPQVLIEAFASRLPVVATAVGGVPDMAEGAALLIPPGDPQAAADQLLRLARDAQLREQLVSAGITRIEGHTLEGECQRVADFIRAAPGGK